MLSKVISELDKLNYYVTFNSFNEDDFNTYKDIIVYNYNSISTNNRFRIDIKVVSEDLLRCLDIKKEIEDMFISHGETGKLKDFTSIKIQGSSSYKDPDLEAVHLNFSLYFVTQRRFRNG